MRTRGKAGVTRSYRACLTPGASYIKFRAMSQSVSTSEKGQHARKTMLSVEPQGSRRVWYVLQVGNSGKSGSVGEGLHRVEEPLALFSIGDGDGSEEVLTAPHRPQSMDERTHFESWTILAYMVDNLLCELKGQRDPMCDHDGWWDGERITRVRT